MITCDDFIKDLIHLHHALTCTQAAALSAALQAIADAQHAADIYAEQQAAAAAQNADWRLAQHLHRSRDENDPDLAAAFAAAALAADQEEQRTLTVSLRVSGATVGRNSAWGPAGCCAILAMPCGALRTACRLPDDITSDSAFHHCS